MNNNSYTFDITLTNACNFQCIYCVERGYFVEEYLSMENAKIIIDNIKKLTQSNYFKSIMIDTIDINFWGGEPLLNIDVMKFIIDQTKDMNVTYSLFTNGYLLTKELLSYIKDINTYKKFQIQISYDGVKLQELCRLSSLEKTTTNVIKDRIKNLNDMNIPYHLKSTVSFQYFKYLYDAYMDIYNLGIELGNTLNHSITIDYSPQTYSKLDPTMFETYKKDLEYNLLQIAKKEKEFLLNAQKNIFTWFDPNTPEISRAMCGAGCRYYSIDIDGNVYTCHGCLYSSKKEEHIITNIITDSIEDIENKLCKMDLYFHDIFDKKYECSDCNVSICYRCNVIKYELSKKTDYKEKWLDYKTQPYLCSLYKMVSNIHNSLLLIIKKELYQKEKDVVI